MKTMYICSETLVGMYSALYDAWRESRDTDAGIELRGEIQQRFFCDYRIVSEEVQKAVKMERMIKKNLGYNAYWHIYQSLLSDDAGKVEAVFRTMQEARHVNDSRRIMEHLANPDVARVFELSRKVSNEAHMYKEFIRFRELENRVLFSEIRPRAQILTCIADHFADRFPLENWMIYDTSHEIFLVHRSGNPWRIVMGRGLNRQEVNRVSKEEKRYEKLWQVFFQSVSIKERENPDLQQSHLPLRYRENMPEFFKT